MGLTLLVARVLLAAVLTVAALAKLSDRAGSRKAIVEFGLPPFLAAPLGIVLPLAELAVAMALMPASTVLWGAIGAFVLLSVFVVGIGVNLARGRKPDCHCFGQLHSAPAGWNTLARNGVLGALAGFVVWQGWNGNVGPSAVAWLGALPATQLLALGASSVMLALLAGQWWFLLHLLRQNGRLLVRVETLEGRPASAAGAMVPPEPSQNGHSRAEGLPVDTPAPSFELPNLQGEKLTLGTLRSQSEQPVPVMLLFTDPSCGPCNDLLPEVGRWQEKYQGKLTVALMSGGDSEENRVKAQEHGLRNVLLQEDWEIADTYRVGGTPSAVLVGAEGTIASPVAGGVEAIKRLLARAVGELHQFPIQQRADQGQPCPNYGKAHPDGNGSRQAMQASVQVGQPAPEVKLPNLDGTTVELRDFMGEQTLVLFWNPGCGFCQRMLPDLKEWEADPPEGAPKLLVVSAGGEGANREMGLSSTVVLDQRFAAGRAFGASGTLSAVLVDAEGNVASEVATGAPGVLHLAGARQAGARSQRSGEGNLSAKERG